MSASLVRILYLSLPPSAAHEPVLTDASGRGILSLQYMLQNKDSAK